MAFSIDVGEKHVYIHVQCTCTCIMDKDWQMEVLVFEVSPALEV